MVILGTLSISKIMMVIADYWEDFDECCVGGRNLTLFDILKQPSLGIRAIRATGFVQAYDKIKAMPNVNFSESFKP